jgi:DNA-directed RNA polymerase specialized sigma24 family protein
VRAAQAGDRTAFGLLYTEYAGLVHAMAMSRVSADEAADVVQDVFLKALRQLPTLRPWKFPRVAHIPMKQRAE